MNEEKIRKRNGDYYFYEGIFYEKGIGREIDINKAIEDIIIECYFLENQSFTGEKIKDV